MDAAAAAAAEARDPVLEDLVRQFEAILTDGVRLIEETGEEQLNRRPHPEKWSISECMEHLNVTLSLFLPRIKTTIAEANRAGLQPRGDFRIGPVWHWLCRKLEPPYKRKLKAPRLFDVSGKIIPKAGLRSRFEELHREMIEVLDLSRSVDLGRTRVASPVSRLITMKLGHCYIFLAAHERRHLWQARGALDLVRAHETERGDQGD